MFFSSQILFSVIFALEPELHFFPPRKRQRKRQRTCVGDSCSVLSGVPNLGWECKMVTTWLSLTVYPLLLSFSFLFFFPFHFLFKNIYFNQKSGGFGRFSWCSCREEGSGANSCAARVLSPNLWVVRWQKIGAESPVHGNPGTGAQRRSLGIVAMLGKYYRMAEWAFCCRRRRPSCFILVCSHQMDWVIALCGLSLVISSVMQIYLKHGFLNVVEYFTFISGEAFDARQYLHVFAFGSWNSLLLLAWKLR